MKIEHLGFAPDLVDYQAALARQRATHAEVVAGAEDTVYLLEHAAVYTAGVRTRRDERPLDGTPVIDVDRGGSITWHGPGQLVGYPIVRLPEPIDVIAFVRALEEVMIRTCADFGVTAERIAGKSGAWVCDEVGERKVGAVGIRVSKGVAMHGFALNVMGETSWADAIVPCGLPDADVTTIAAEAGRELTVAAAAQRAEIHLREMLA